MSLTIVYGARRFKIPVTSGTLLSQVRDQVCSSDGGLGLPSSEYGLVSKGKQLDLTLPFRFANLVNNAQLDLVKIQKPSTVRVKIRIPGHQDFIGSFPSTSTVQNVLDSANLRGQLLLNNVEAQPGTELASLGGVGGIMFVFKGDVKAQRANNTGGAAAVSAVSTSPSQLKTAQQQQQPQQPQQQSSQPKLPTADLPEAHRAPVVGTPQSRSSQQLADDEPPEMSSQQFIAYYQHIKRQAEPPMISKETKARLNPKQNIESTTIRVKFPDQNTLEGKFANGELGRDVYQFVKLYLKSPNTPFELVSMSPHFVLQPDAHLLEDCNFGSRALLLFRGEKSGASYLNEKAMAIARPLSQNPDEEGSQKKKDPSSSSSTKQIPSESKEKDPKSSLKAKLKPKWLKLHK